MRRSTSYGESPPTVATWRAFVLLRPSGRGEGSCFAEVLATRSAACLRMCLGACEPRARADTHSLASSIVFSVFFIVSFAFVSLIVIMSLRTVTTMMVSGMHSVWMMHVAREQ